MDGMRVARINIGAAETISHRGREFETGIRKRAVDGPVAIGPDGVGDDVICDLENHGGADQAVYAYGTADYEWWSSELGRSVEPGTFGENLTIDGLPDDLHVGDRLLIGNVILEATSPRIPCATLSAEMGDSNFGMAFRRAERPGFYFRVLNPGEISAGDAVTLAEDPSSGVTMLDLFRLRYDLSPDAGLLDRALAAPVAERMRELIQSKRDALS